MYDDCRKKLTQPGVFPIRLQDDELQWKVAMYYDVGTEKFILHINEQPFDQMPY